MNEAELKETASAYGEVLDLYLRDCGPKKPRDGWVEFRTVREAESAVNELDGRAMADWHLLLEAKIDRSGDEARSGYRRDRKSVV